MPARPYAVLLTAGAEQDLESMYDYTAQFDSPVNADYVLDRLTAVIDDLSLFPERGSHPHGLLALGMRDFRQVNFKPYRVIYRVIASKVYIYLIADGRRDMESLLLRRLLIA